MILMIVDDEELIRNGIAARINYLGYRFDKILQAGDGVEAIEMIDKMQENVDILITDIRMPDMDGLTLVRRARKINPGVQSIILSGYAEFDYAEQAIKEGVISYLLKPISNDALKDALDKAINNKNADILELEKNNRQEKTLREKNALLLEKDINRLLKMEDENVPERIQLENSIYEMTGGIIHDGDSIILLLIQIDSASYEKKQFIYGDTDLIRFSLCNIFNELVHRNSSLIVNNTDDPNQLFAVISVTDVRDIRQQAEQICVKLMSVLWEQMDLSVTIGVSTVNRVLCSETLRQAQNALLQRLSCGSGNLYFYDDIKELEIEKMPIAEMSLLEKYMERCDAGNIQAVLNEIFSEENAQRYSPSYLRVLWVRIINLFLKCDRGKLIDRTPLKKEQLLDFHVLDRFDSIMEAEDYLYHIILNCIGGEEHVDTDTRSKIELAANYIDQHYYEDIAINDLAEKYSMSPNYFSATFSKEKGVTTVNYIAKVRIDKACTLLRSTQKSVAEIAESVGYHDSQYFFKVFKRETGQTPLQYRNRFK